MPRHPRGPVPRRHPGQRRGADRRHEMQNSSLLSVGRPRPAQAVPQSTPCNDPSVSRGSRGAAWSPGSPPYRALGCPVPEACVGLKVTDSWLGGFPGVRARRRVRAPEREIPHVSLLPTSSCSTGAHRVPVRRGARHQACHTKFSPCLPKKIRCWGGRGSYQGVPVQGQGVP